MKTITQDDLKLAPEITLTVSESFVEADGIERTRAIAILAAAYMKDRAPFIKAPRDQRRFKPDQNKVYNSAWIRCATGVWISYDEPQDILHAAIPDGGNEHLNKFGAFSVYRTLTGHQPRSPKTFEVNVGRGDALGLPSNRSRHYVLVSIEDASKTLTMTGDAFAALIENMKVIEK